LPKQTDKHTWLATSLCKRPLFANCR